MKTAIVLPSGDVRELDFQKIHTKLGTVTRSMEKKGDVPSLLKIADIFGFDSDDMVCDFTSARGFYEAWAQSEGVTPHPVGTRHFHRSQR